MHSPRMWHNHVIVVSRVKLGAKGKYTGDRRRIQLYVINVTLDLKVMLGDMGNH